MIWQLFGASKLVYLINQESWKKKKFCGAQMDFLANYVLRKTEYIITDHKMWVIFNIKNIGSYDLGLKYIPSKERQLY